MRPYCDSPSHWEFRLSSGCHIAMGKGPRAGPSRPTHIQRFYKDSTPESKAYIINNNCLIFSSGSLKFSSFRLALTPRRISLWTRMPWCPGTWALTPSPSQGKGSLVAWPPLRRIKPSTVPSSRSFLTSRSIRLWTGASLPRFSPA